MSRASLALCIVGFATSLAAGEAVPLFDGKTLAGWNGNPDAFRVEAGCLVGGQLDAPVPRNEFLTHAKTFGDFELRLQCKLVGGEQVNAGIQIRSRRIPKHHEMIGYQADLGQHYWGALYDESRRRTVLAGPTKEVLTTIVKPGEWNDYVIRCEGRRIQLWLNGVQTVDYTESDDEIEQTGLIGLQIHGGPPSEAWYRKITLESLGD